MLKSLLTTIAVCLVMITEAQAKSRPMYTGIPWLDEAIHFIGSGPSEVGVRKNLWCAAGVNKFLKNKGYKGTGSDKASSFATYGKSTKPKPGAIAVMARKGGGGHVAIVVKDLGSKVLTVSPNYSNTVKYVTYNKSEIYAYRWPVG